MKQKFPANPKMSHLIVYRQEPIGLSQMKLTKKHNLLCEKNVTWKAMNRLTQYVLSKLEKKLSIPP